MNNLTRENFWNALEDKYPIKVKEFYNWLNNEYFEEVSWPSLFRDSGNGCLYDYFDLPIAMQIWIFMQFVMEGNHFYMVEINTSLSFDHIKG